MSCTYFKNDELSFKDISKSRFKLHLNSWLYCDVTDWHKTDLTFPGRWVLIMVCWDINLCSLVGWYQCCFHLYGRKIPEDGDSSFSHYVSIYLPNYTASHPTRLYNFNMKLTRQFLCRTLLRKNPLILWSSFGDTAGGGQTGREAPTYHDVS